MVTEIDLRQIEMFQIQTKLLSKIILKGRFTISCALDAKLMNEYAG